MKTKVVLMYEDEKERVEVRTVSSEDEASLMLKGVFKIFEDKLKDVFKSTHIEVESKTTNESLFEDEEDCETNSLEDLIQDTIMNEIDENPEFKEFLRSQLLEDFMEELRSLNYWPNQDFAKEHFENLEFSKSLISFVLRNYERTKEF